MTNQSLPHSHYEKYRGSRALEFLRVSTPEQKKMYGWPRQHAEITQKLIEPLNLQVVHTIKDSYTGLDFEMHDALDEALKLAKQGKYDILILDMLDRLGRKGIEREIYLMELKQEGVRVVSADPTDHSDDDTSWGEIIRYLKGKASEEEIKTMTHRTMGGKRAKAMGDPEKGIPPMVVGSGHRRYGYEYILNEKGKRVGLKLKEDIILTEADGTKWTEPKVVKFVFESSASGMSLKQIADILNAKGIPSPYTAKGIKRKVTEYGFIWHPSGISNMLRDKGYAGEVTMFKTRNLKRKPGKRFTDRVKTDPSEQITINIPAIISMELYQEVRARLQKHKREATRNANHPELFLLRAGLVRCGYCGRVMSGAVKGRTPGHLPSYRCHGRYGVENGCKGTTINAPEVDTAAWEKALEFINDPESVDRKVAEQRKKDPTKKKRAEINAKIKEIQQHQENFRKQLRDAMMEGTLDKGTKDFLTEELNQLATRELEWNDQLLETENQQEQWKKVDKKLTKIHETAKRVRENLSDPTYTPTYQEKRDLIEFFNIRAIVWRHDHRPRFKIEANPEEIENTPS